MTDSAKPVLVLGTGNQKKRLEMTELLATVGLEIKTLRDFDQSIDVVEDGESFAENATKKAVEQARNLNRWVLAEDSGIAVDALDGRPGIYSARYSGPEATDESNNRLLLKELGDLPLGKRTAHYVCHMTLSDPTGTVRADCEARCNGRILFEEQGTNGFGYDPLFEVVEYHTTFGRLAPAVKSCLSHRARAARLIIPQLMALVDTGEWT